MPKVLFLKKKKKEKKRTKKKKKQKTVTSDDDFIHDTRRTVALLDWTEKTCEAERD